MDEVPNSIPWWKSAVIRRLALSIAVQLVAVTHTSKYLAGVDLGALIDDLLELGGIAYAGWAIHARATKPMPEVVSSQAKADVANVISSTIVLHPSSATPVPEKKP
jgi:hypothetical protein